MRAIWITRHGGPEVLEVREAPDPEPGHGEVRVRVRAAGLNFAEVMARQGLYPGAPKPPCVVGYEAAGVIDAVGPGVTDRAVGDRVAALTRFGAHADTVCAPARNTFGLPDAMGFEEAAAIPVTYLTAYHMLFRVGHLAPGETVLIHMAAGGVGIAAIQLCRTVPGVRILGTASAGKHGTLREIGCDEPIDYHTVDYEAEVRRLTGGEGVDLVLDPLGGNDWRKGYRLLKPVGRLIAFGFSNAITGQRRNLLKLMWQGLRVPLFTPIGLMKSNRTLAGVDMGQMWHMIDMLTGEMNAVLEHWQRGEIRAKVDAVIPFDRVAEAHGRIEGRQNVGKIVLVP